MINNDEMINHEMIRKYLENLIFGKLQSYLELDAQIIDKSVVASETYTGKEKKDIIVVLKFLPATNINGVEDMPIQVMVDVKSEYQDIIYDVLHEIAITNNQVIGSADSYKFKQFYNTPILLSTFQNIGAYKSSTMSMDMRIVSFGPIAISNDIYFSLSLGNDTYVDDPEDDEDEIDRFKLTLLNAIFSVEHVFDGMVTNGNPLQKNTHNSYNTTLTLSYILDKDSAIHKLLHNNATGTSTFSIGYNPVSEEGFNNFLNYYYLQSYTENILVSDVTKVTVSFISRGD